MVDLLAKRCQDHPDREAAARCPSCSQYFCRECVTEHEDAVICTACLKRQIKREKRRGFGLGPLLRMGLGMAGAALSWLYFCWMGRFLLAIPSPFHEGTLWSIGFWDK